jgi:PAS domain S-box-containing protein
MKKKKLPPVAVSGPKLPAKTRSPQNMVETLPDGIKKDMLRLFHELGVKQIEREMQNAELRKTRDDLETSLGKYTDLYDFSPVAYFTLARNGAIVKLNLTGVTFLGLGRSLLIGRNFSLFVPDKERPAFFAFLNRVFSSEAKESYETAITKGGYPANFVRIEAVCDRSSHDCSMAVIDISEYKRLEGEIIAYQEDLRAMATEISLVEERERRKIATALHDQVGQNLAMASYKLGELRQAVIPGTLGGQVDEIREMLTLAIRNSRTLTFELSPPILYDLGLEAAVCSLAERYRKEHGIRIDSRDDTKPKPLSADMRIILFQGVRELLVNSIKHALPRSITISCLREGTDIRIVVEDDGVGFPTSDGDILPGKTHSFGLFSLRERLKCLGGSIDIKSAPGHGTQITLTAPLATEQDVHRE